MENKIDVNKDGLERLKITDCDGDGFPKPTYKNIKTIHDAVSKNGEFVKKFFENNKLTNEENHDKDIIKLRAILINSIDSANLQFLRDKDAPDVPYYNLISEQIYKNKLEEKIQKGESLNYVLQKNKYKKSTFVFMSKYVSKVAQYCYHENDRYSIFDSVFEDNLKIYVEHFWPNFENEFIDKKFPDLKKYRKDSNDSNLYYDGYCKLIGRVIEQVHLYNVRNDNQKGTITREEFDHFIWFIFRNNKKNKNNKSD